MFIIIGTLKPFITKQIKKKSNILVRLREFRAQSGEDLIMHTYIYCISTLSYKIYSRSVICFNTQSQISDMHTKSYLFYYLLFNLTYEYTHTVYYYFASVERLRLKIM